MVVPSARSALVRAACCPGGVAPRVDERHGEGVEVPAVHDRAGGVDERDLEGAAGARRAPLGQAAVDRDGDAVGGVVVAQGAGGAAAGGGPAGPHGQRGDGQRERGEARPAGATGAGAPRAPARPFTDAVGTMGRIAARLPVSSRRAAS